MSDFNARSSDEQLWLAEPEIISELDLFLQELDILFSFEIGQVMGHRKLGTSLEHMLWSTSFNATYMTAILTDQISDTCFSGINFNWSVEVQILKGVTRDIGVISIHIKNKENVQLSEQTFVFK